MSDNREKDLKVLKVIAETLNRSNDLEGMLQSVLAELVKVTSITTGWIFLVDDRKPYYTYTASHNLPPALSWRNNKPMCDGTCYCLNRYWDGELTEPVNIIGCKRLKNAIKYSWGETNGLTHHATVPLSAGGERFGVLNVAAPHKKQFSDEELTLLQSVAYQIGTAVKRTKLYQSQKKRAENFALLDEVIRFIWSLSNVKELPGKIVEKCDSVFAWPLIAFYRKTGNVLRLKASNKVIEYPCEINIESGNDVSKAFSEKHLVKNYSAFQQMRSIGFPAYESSIAIPIASREAKVQGVIVIAGEKYNTFSDSDVEVLKVLSEHISLAIEAIHVNQQRQELVVYEERNRLARDLHDSVNQKLFSLSLTSRGVKEMLAQDDTILINAMSEMQELAQSSLTEMKSLIWQLRPAGVEEGLITALRKYAAKLGLMVSDSVQGVYNFPIEMEETLWRIGQEALNNVKKHADAQNVSIKLKSTVHYTYLEISDDGKGFELEKQGIKKWTLGLSTMRERAEIAGGEFTINSCLGKGTTVTIMIPRQDETGDQHDN